MSQKRAYGRVQRLKQEIAKRGIAGRWVPGSYLGPGVRTPEAHMSYLWGPDGLTISVAASGARASISLMTRGGRARRPIVMQVISGTGTPTREVVRMELSDFLDLLEVYTKWLAQEGRLGEDE